MRKLASIQKITALDPIPNSDAIEKATILGWEVVVTKSDKFKVGDLCVYCEIDSILPDKPEFEFLRDRKFRIKTIKLRGQVSQGICFPLSILPKLNNLSRHEGDDVTDLIGVTKYDPQAEWERKETDRLSSIDRNRMSKFLKRYAWYRRLMFKPTRTSFPSFIRKTDEDRIQLFPNYYERWKDLKFNVTEKIDGQSVTYFMIKNPKTGIFRKSWIFGVCSRNFQLLRPDNSSYWTLVKDLNIKEKMLSWCKINNRGLILQGEAIGPKIQGNKYKCSKVDLFIFDVATYDNGKTIYLDQEEQMMTCYEMNLCIVPWLETNYELKSSILAMVEDSKGSSRIDYDTPREGTVWRNYENDISFKVVNADFLLKYSE